MGNSGGNIFFLTGFWRRLSSAFLAFAIVLATIPTGSLLFPQIARAASVTVNCSGTAGSPTAVTESDLTGNDVTFSDTGGDGYCVLDAAISANSVVVGLGVVLTHAAEVSTGVNITTTGNLTITGDIKVNGNGCQGVANSDGYGPDGSNVCTVTTAGYGDGNGSFTGGEGGGYGGAGGAGSLSAGGNTYGSPTAPTLQGSSGGGASANAGGAGGGYIRLNAGGVLTVNGTLVADGSNGTAGGNQSSGGGSGGAIYITTVTMDGTGSISANGGNGVASTDPASGFDSGSGGGGRIAITYSDTAGSDFSFSSSSLSASAGTETGTGTAGSKGTVYVKDTSANSVRIFHGFDFDDTDYSVTTWTADSSATNQYCTTAAATPSITASGTLTLDGTLTCSSSSLTSFNLGAGTLSLASGVTVDLSSAQKGGDMDINITGGGSTTWTNAIIKLPPEGFLTIDDAVTLSLAGTTTATANVQLTNLTAFTLGASASISANSLGCQGVANSDGYGPDGSNVCTVATAGYGDGNGSFTGGEGGGHGGAGGAGTLSAGGNTYDSETAPVLLGSSGGGSQANRGGHGGGLIRIQATTLTNSGGTLSANGGAGLNASSNQSSGGGSGGSIYLSAMGTLTMESGTVTTTGGAGQTNSGFNSGSGGGGRVRIDYASAGSGTTTYLGTLTAGGVAAKGTGGANDGANGTLSSADLPGFSSALYKDSDSNGVVDQVVITFDESVSLGGTVASTRFTWTSSSGVNGFAGSLSGNASASGTDVTITIGSADANETGHTTVPAIAYNDNSDDGTNKIQDADGNIVQTFTAQNVTDGAKPVVVTKQYEDGDTSGTIDRVGLTLSEAASTQTAVLGDFAYVANDITGSSLTSGTLSYPSSTTVRLALGTAGNANITGHTTAPTLAYTDGGSTAIADAAGNQLATFAAANLSDGAVPIITTRRYEDSDGNGTVDRLSFALSEAASTQTAVLGDFVYTAGSITGSALSGGTLSYPSSTAIRIVLGTAGNAAITSHSTAPTIAYTDGGATAIADAAGNQLPTFSAITLSDAAAPAFVSAATTSTTNVRITMSEAVSSATFGAAGGWTATGLTPSAVAINSDTTKLDLTVSAVNQGYTAADFAFTSGVSGSAISDAASNATASFTSKSITDGVAPDAPGSFTRSTGSGTTATFTWTVTPDTNFNHYEIWYGTSSTDVTNRNGTASEWDNDPNDSNLATRTTTTTTVTGLTAGSTYYALICAVDNASNETCSSSVSFVTNQAPTVATVTGSEATNGTGNVTVSFIMDDPDDDNTLQALVEYSTNGGTSWSKATLGTADADTTATYGTPRVDNSATYQVGKASNYITSSSGANTVTVKWQSATDAPTANVSNAKIRVTPYDGVAAGTAATSSDFTLDNVDPSNPTVDSSTTVSGPGLTFDTTITGTKDANTAIRNNGTQVVELDSNTTWSYNVRLVTGDNVYSFTAIDAKGNESSVTSHTIVYTRRDGGIVISSGRNSKSSDGDSEAKDSGIVETVESTPAPPEPQQPPADPEDARKKLLDAASVVVDTVNGAMEKDEEDVGTLTEKAEEEKAEEEKKKIVEEPSSEITVAVDGKPVEILATRDKMLKTENYQQITPVDEAGIPVWIQQKFSKDKKEKAITNDSDLDGDNILDMEEILLGTKLDSKDSDGDGISDDKEIAQGINPTAWDTDHDGVSDRNEALHGTNPKNSDSDNDGFLDMEEISAGSDPKDNKDKPPLNKQGIPEEWVNKYRDWKEVKYNEPQKIRGIEKEVKLSFAMMDMDGDGLTDENEYKLGTNPTHEDTDRDGVSDGAEVHDYKTDPTRDTETELLYSTKASNLKPQGNTFSGTPVVRGIGQPNSTVEVIFLPSQKEKSPMAWMLFANSFGVDTNGMITELIQADSTGKFFVSPNVKDGDYTVVIRSLDTDGAITEESLPYEVKIDSSLSLLAEKTVIPLQLDTKAIDIENLQLITIDNNRPYLYGTAKKGYEVVISWESQLYTSSLVVDTDEGEFAALAPADLDSGEHSLYIYAVEPVKNLSTPPITINFNILDLDADFNILSTASIFTDSKLLARVGIPLLLILILSLILIRVKFRGKIL